MIAQVVRFQAIRIIVIFTLFFFSHPLFSQISNPPTQTDSLIIDANNNNAANSGDRIRYKVNLNNTGSSPANGVNLIINPDPKTIFVPGSFRSTPLAIDDTFNVTGNVGITVPEISGVLTNDFDDNIPGLTVMAFVGATTQGGTINLATNGSFTYSPPAGFVGTDTYTYTLLDGNAVPGMLPSSTGTIRLQVSNLVWFIDNTVAGSGGSGVLSNPFRNIAEFNASAGPGSGHIVFIKQSPTEYNGNILLKTAMFLYGSGHTGGMNLGDVLPFVLPAHSNTLPAINTTAPTLTNTSGNAVTLVLNNLVRGVNIGQTTGYAFVDNIGTIGMSTISDCTISGSGSFINFANGGTINASFGSLSSSSSTVPLFNLTNIAGSITQSSAGTITHNGAVNSINVSGGSVAMTLTSSLSKTSSGAVLSVTNGHTGNLQFAGNVSSNSASSTGIQLSNADGSYNFSFLNLTAGTEGVYIQNGSSGSFNVTNTSSAIQNINGISFRMNNSTSNVNYDGSITHSTPGSTGIELIGATGVISFDGNLQIGTVGSPMTSTAVFLSATGNVNAITFGNLNVITGIGGGSGARALVSETSGLISGTIASIDCNGNLGVDNHCIDISNSGFNNLTINYLLSDHDDVGENGGAIQLTNTTGILSILDFPRLTGRFGNIIEAANFGTLNISTTTNGTIASTARSAINLTNGTANITTGAIGVFDAIGYGIRLENLGPSSNINIPAQVDISMAAGASENILVNNCPASSTISIGTNGASHSLVNLTTRRANAIRLTGALGTTRFGNVTANNTQSVTVPAIFSSACAGTIQFASANINMNNAGGFENFTDEFTPQNNSGDGDAVYISSFTGSNFVFNGGTIQLSGDDGIDIRSSSNLTLNNVIIQDVGKNPGVTCVGCNSSGVQAYNLSGTLTVSNSSFLRARLRNFYVSNTTGTLNFNVSSSTFSDTRASGSPATDNLQVYAGGNSSMAIDIENSTFTKSRTHQVNVVPYGNAAVTKFDFTGCTMDNDGGPSSGINLDAIGASTMNFNIMNNVKLHAQDENVITIASGAAGGTSQVQGRIMNNPNMAFTTSSPGGSVFGLVRVLSDGSTSLVNVQIESNAGNLNNGTDGINLSVQGASAAKIIATVKGNTLTSAGTAGIPLEAINAFVNPTLGGTKELCLNVMNNTVSGIWARALRARALSPTGLIVTNYTGNIGTTWTGNGNTSGAIPTAEFTSGGGTIVNGAACALPSNPMP